MAKATKKQKLALNQGIAIALSLVVLGAFTPFLFAGVQTASIPMVSDVSVATPALPDPYINQVDGQVVLDLEAYDVVSGDGEMADYGDIIYVHYVGQLENGEVFDTSTNKAAPFPVELGAGQVITGWELGLKGMREGGTRRLVVPASLAYGSEGVFDAYGNEIIPENATLIFDVALLKVVKQ